MTSQTNPIANIANGGTTSQILDLHGNQLVGFYTPTLTSTSITFQAASDLDQTFVTVKGATGGSALTFTVASNGYYGFTNDLVQQFRGVRYIQVVCGTSEGAARAIPLCIFAKSSW